VSNLVYSLGIVLAIEIAVFAMLYRWTRFAGKQIAFFLVVIAVALFLPFGILNWQGLDYFIIHVTFYIMIPYVLGIITSHWEARQAENSETPQRWFHWGPAVLVGFFLTLVVVDGTILTLAEKGMNANFAKRFLPEPRSKNIIVSKFPGPVSHDYQEKEAQFNQYLKARESQQKRGWKVQKGWLGKAIANQPAIFKIKVVDQQGDPVSQASVTGRFLRSSDENKDIEFSMQESNPGEYLVKLILPEPGRWSLVAKIERGDESHEVRAVTQVQKE